MSQLPIYSIGYGARDLDAFIEVLKVNRIAFLADVRSRPYSRYKPDFSKLPLATELSRSGIGYVFMGDELGGQPDDPSCYDNQGKIDYEKCRLRPQFRVGIDRLHTAHAKNLRLVLMCSESKPENCHRTKLISEVLVKEGIEVMHIDEDDYLLRHEQIMLRVIKGQPSLFGDEFFKHTSRKVYAKPDDESE